MTSSASAVDCSARCSNRQAAALCCQVSATSPGDTITHCVKAKRDRHAKCCKTGECRVSLHQICKGCMVANSHYSLQSASSMPLSIDPATRYNRIYLNPELECNRPLNIAISNLSASTSPLLCRRRRRRSRDFFDLPALLNTTCAIGEHADCTIIA